MSIIIPSILTASRDDVLHKLSLLTGLVDTVQIDVVDGVFADNTTWPYSEGASELALLSEGEGGLHAFGNFTYEVDLMVANPEESAGAWVEAGATKVVLHVESGALVGKALEQLEKHYGHEKGFVPGLLSLGLALNIDTPSELLHPYLPRIDYVQFMGIRTIGKQGEPFDPQVIEKIAAFKKEHRDIPVQVDGGVSFDTAPKLLETGARSLVVGSDLWHAGNVEEELNRLTDLADEHGIFA